MRPFICAGAGFLLAVLWFDLMFDVQVSQLGERESALASIAAYYGRVTTAARPMNRLVALAMLATLGSLIAQIARGEGPKWVGWASLALAATPIALAGARTVPNAVRLGRREDPTSVQAALAHSIYRDHLFCIAAIATVLVLELSSA